MLGSWKVDVNVGGMPEVVATAFGQLANLVGAEYTPIAYLGVQVVNGTNYAVLAKQTLLDGKDSENVVLVIFNQKPGALEANLVNIERVLEGGSEFGGVDIDVQTDEFPKAAQLALDKALVDFVGSSVKAFAYLGSQVVRGTNYFFAAEVAPVAENPANKVALITVNNMDNAVSFTDILAGSVQVSLGKPLGEWP